MSLNILLEENETFANEEELEISFPDWTNLMNSNLVKAQSCLDLLEDSSDISERVHFLEEAILWLQGNLEDINESTVQNSEFFEKDVYEEIVLDTKVKLEQAIQFKTEQCLLTH